MMTTTTTPVTTTLPHLPMILSPWSSPGEIPHGAFHVLDSGVPVGVPHAERPDLCWPGRGEGIVWGTERHELHVVCRRDEHDIITQEITVGNVRGSVTVSQGRVTVTGRDGRPAGEAVPLVSEQQVWTLLLGLQREARDPETGAARHLLATASAADAATPLGLVRQLEDACR